MFEISDRSTGTCVVLTAEGAVEGAEYEVFAERFEAAVKEHGQVDLVVILSGPVRYGDLDAFKEDWRFAFADYHHARRAAFVGEQHVINAMMRVFSPFTRVEDRVFSTAELDEAIAWASGN